MRKSPRSSLSLALRPAAVAAVGAAALVLPAAPAIAADTEDPAAGPQSRLVLTMTPGLHSPGSEYTLECQPPGGTHPDAVGACAKLSAAAGDFDKLVPTGAMGCQGLHDPVTVSARGTWLGGEVAWSKTFGNSCEAITATNFVFRF
ncbi:subtilase-type protease inhibitor [Streptomyces sp. enrichment culture]|uniref:Subtilisin inhibitor-like n=1 Tax=Streptomyces radiopugnans TaxID=403935 RepID=A0A1H8Z6J9_9ACTN|nr:Subtilisin inhibitor-like [Streptomyces radiopugnans]